MTLIFQRCSVCGFERQNAPSALPTCCNKKMIVVAERDVGLGRHTMNIRLAAGPSDMLMPKVARARISRPDAATILRTRFCYGLPEAPKMGHYDEIL